VSLRALERAAATVEDFCKTYLMMLDLKWQHVFFQVLPLSLFFSYLTCAARARAHTHTHTHTHTEGWDCR
jgi:hypothetical protein